MNEIKLYGSIGYPGMTSAAFKSLLADCDPSQELVIRIDSEGGSVFDGFGIFDSIKAFQGPTRAVVESSAFSIASFIAMAADTVEITENGYLMLHNPYTQVEGDDAELAKQASMLGNLKQNMIAAYAEKTGKSAAEVEQMMADETWLGAVDAQASGLVDSILPTARKSVAVARFKGNMPERVQSSLNVSDHSSGEVETQKGNNLMSNPKILATTKSIKLRWPSAKSDFIVAALDQEMTDEQVAEMYYSEMVKENEELKAKLAAMEEEMVALKAKAEQMTVTETEEEDDEEEKMVLMPAARAKAKGVQPVKTTGGVSHIASAAQAWNEKVADKVKAGMRHQHAVAAVNRENPGLRQRMVDEANA